MTTRRFWAWAGAITVAAFLLRILGVTRHALDLDEMLQYYIACRPGSLRELFPLLRGMPLHAVLDPLFTFAMAKVSRELWWLRLQPVVLGTACVPALIALARRYGDATAYTAGALLAVSVHHIEFSGFVDFYPFLTLWSLTTTYLLLKAADGGDAGFFAAYAAATAGFLYTHPWAVLLTGLHGLWILVWRRERSRAFLLACAAAGLAFLPWFLSASSRLFGDPGFSYHFPQRPPLANLWATLESWAGSPERAMYDAAPLKPWLLLAAPLYAAFGALGLARLTRERRWNERWALAALIAFCGAPAVIAIDLLFAYDYAPRQAMFALPFFLMFVAEGLLAVRDLAPGRTAFAGAALTLCVLALGARREFSRQLAAAKDATVLTANRLRAASVPGRTLLFDEPNHAALILFELDRSALLRLDPPRLHAGFYLFGVPEGLSAGGRPVAVIWDPDSTPAQEARRWKDLARKIETGAISPAGSDFGFMRHTPYEKTLQFRSENEASFRRGAGLWPR